MVIDATATGQPAQSVPELPDGTWRFFVVPHTHWDREWY